MKKPITDASGLFDAIDEAGALGLQGKQYTGTSIGALRGVIGQATATANSGQTQAEINAAHEAVVEAAAGLELK